jgi:hypothetical protein
MCLARVGQAHRDLAVQGGDALAFKFQLVTTGTIDGFDERFWVFHGVSMADTARTYPNPQRGLPKSSGAPIIPIERLAVFFDGDYFFFGWSFVGVREASLYFV